MDKSNLSFKVNRIIKNKIYYGLFNNINEVCQYFSENIANEYKDLDDIYKKYLSYFKNLPYILDLKYQDRENFTDKLKDDIKFLEKRGLSYLAVINFSDFLLSYISDYYKIKIEKFDNIKKFDLDMALTEINKLVNLEAGLETLHINGGILLSIVPFSMTKENYYDYIKNSFRILFTGQSKNSILKSIQELKFKFCSFNFLESEEAVKNQFNEVLNIDFKEKSEEEILKVIEKIEEITQKYTDKLGSIGAIYNTLMELFAISNFVIDTKYLFEENFVLKDLFYSTCEMIESNKFDIIGETITKKADEMCEQLIEKIESEENYIKNKVKNFKYSDLTDDIKIMIELDEYIGRVNFEKSIIFSGDFKEDNVIATEEFIDKCSEEFIDYINSLKFENKIIKSYKQQFFAYIPCHLNSKLLKKHFENVLNNLSKSSLLLCSYKILCISSPEKIYDFNKGESENHNCCECDND